MSCLGLLHVAVQRNLAVETSGQLRKNKDCRKNITRILWENIKFLLNVYEI